MERELIEQVTAAVWETSVGTSLVADPGAPEEVGGTVAGCVTITGEWTGAVFVHCLAPVAHRVARIAFSLPEGEPESELVHDAVGELANVIAGNLKAMLPGPGHLSIPTVVDGDDFRVSVPHARVVNRASFRAEEGGVSVTLVQSENMRDV